MSRLTLSLLTAAALAFSNAAAQAAPPRFDAAALSRDTAYLASDALGGRLPGSAGERPTVSYIVARMKAAGLKPGNHGRWTQDVAMVTITPRAKPAVQINRPGADAIDLAGEDGVFWTKTLTPEVSLAPSDLVFVGYGIVAPERAWDDYAGVDVRGKTVVILVNDPDWRAKDGQGRFGGKRLTYYGRYTYKFEEAARHGAAAAIIVHDDQAAGYPFQVLANTNAGAKVDLDPPPTATHPAVEGWLTQAAARRVFQLAGQDLDALTQAAQAPGFHAVPLGLTVSAKFENTLTRSVSQNVIGKLDGTSRRDEAFLYSAHWDHVGACAPNAAGHAICNGAIDNASGVAGLLALAKAFVAAPRPQRSLLFVATTGEEQGLLGSSYYVRHPAVAIAKTAGGVNIDVMNVFGPTRDVMVLNPGLTSLEPLFTQAAQSQGRSLSPDLLADQGLYYRSDQLSLAQAGVPMLFASSGFARAGGTDKSTGLLGYFQHVYHTASDIFDPNWDWSGAMADLALYYAVGHAVADSADWPSWRPGAEFQRRASEPQRPQGPTAPRPKS